MVDEDIPSDEQTTPPRGGDSSDLKLLVAALMAVVLSVTVGLSLLTTMSVAHL
jgi:hypothetical protein